MNHPVSFKVSILGVFGVLFFFAIVMIVAHYNSNNATPAPEVEGDLASLQKEIDTTLFVPRYIPAHLRLSRDWYANKADKWNYREATVIYTSSPGSATLRITQTKARPINQEFMETATGQDDDFTYQRVPVGGYQGLLMFAKYELPINRTGYDPRKAIDLYLLERGTFINLRASDRDFISSSEVLKVAESLTPLD